MKKIIVIAVLFLVTQGVNASVDMFLKIDGVEGESKDSAHSKKSMYWHGPGVPVPIPGKFVCKMSL